MKLRELGQAATPAPWVPVTEGHRWQEDAAARAYDTVMARRDPDEPDIQFTDLSFVRTNDGTHEVAIVGNGAKSQVNSELIAEMRNKLDLLLDVVEAARDVAWVNKNMAEPEEDRLRAALVALDVSQGKVSDAS